MRVVADNADKPLSAPARITVLMPPAILRFCETVLGAKLMREAPFHDGLRGALVHAEAPGDLDGCVARAQARGLRILLPATDLGRMGRFAIIADADGNAVGLHSSRA